MSKYVMCETILGSLVCSAPKSIISGPFGSNIGKRFFKEKGIPVIRGNNLSKNAIKFIDSGFVFVTKEKADELNCFAIKNDIIFTAVGTIGQVGIIEEDLDYNVYVISNKQIRVRFDTNKILPLFAYYWFSAKWMQKIIIQRNVGSTVPLLNLGVIRGLPIKYPEQLNVQRLIIYILENITREIELNNKINAELESMAKLIYDYWFVQFDFPDSNGKPYKSSGGKMVWNEELKREIPEGWEVKKLEELGNFKNGVNYDPSNPGNIECTIINVRNISKSSYLLKNEDLDTIYLSETDVRKYSVHNDSIIIARSGIPGATRLIMDCGENTLYCGFTIHFELDDYANKYPAFFFLKSIEQLIKNGSGGTILKNVNQATLNDLKITLPTDNIQINNFSSTFEPLFQKLSNSQKEVQKVIELRDWLLPMLMNGQVKVEP